MNGSFSRRHLLRGAASLAALAAAPRAAVAAEPASPAVCMSFVFTNKSRFDGDRFRDHHLPLLRRIYGDSVERIELRLAPRPAKGQPLPPIPASVALWIRSIPAFGEAAAKGGQEITADLEKVSKSPAYVQYEQVIAQVGDARDAVPGGTPVSSLFYPNGDEAKWDAQQYVGTYLPLMVETYGLEAIRRVEVVRGAQAPGGGRAPFIAAVHTYLRDEALFQSRARSAGMRLMGEAAKVTAIRPLFGNFRVHAAG